MKIEDFEGASDSMNDEDIERALAKRYGEDVNEFWLSHAEGKFPAISILVKGDIAVLHYFPKDQSPGMTSIGEGVNLEAEGATIFCINAVDEEQQIPNRMAVHFSLALIAAKQFFVSKEPPSCINWLAL